MKPEALRGAVLALGASLGVGALAARRLSDFDLPFHLAVGRQAVAHGGLERVDDLSFTHPTVRYAELAADVPLYAVMRSGGPLALQLLGGLAALATATLLYGRLRREGPLALAGVALAVGAIDAYWLVRPATLSFVALAGLLWLLHAQAAPLPRRRALGLAAGQLALLALWANLHGFVVLGAGVALGHGAYRALCALARGRAGAWLPADAGARGGLSLLTGLLGVAAVLLNPAGPELLLAPLRTQQDFTRITEWATTTPSFLYAHAPLTGLVLLLSVLALALGRGPCGRLPTALQLGTLLLGLVLARSAVRLLPVAVLLLTPVWVERLSWLVPRHAASRWLTASLTLLVGPWLWRSSTVSHGVGFEPAHFPIGACEYVRSARLQGNPYNFLPYGGYLAWALHPEQRVLVDGRTTWVHERDKLDAYFAAERSQAAFDALADRYRLEWALVRASEGEPFGRGLVDGRWAMLYWDDASAVYVRREGPNAALAARGYQLLHHLLTPGQVLQAALTGQLDPQQLAHDAALALAQAPESPRAEFLDGVAAWSVGDAARLTRATGALERLRPGHPGVGLLRQLAASAATGGR